MTRPRYSSRVICRPSSTSTRETFWPSGPVWCVTSVMPIICRASCSASAGLLATLTPPPLPRPPAWICALTTTTPPPSFSAIALAAAASVTRLRRAAPARRSAQEWPLPDIRESSSRSESIWRRAHGATARNAIESQVGVRHEGAAVVQHCGWHKDPHRAHRSGTRRLPRPASRRQPPAVLRPGQVQRLRAHAGHQSALDSRGAGPAARSSSCTSTKAVDELRAQPRRPAGEIPEEGLGAAAPAARSWARRR